MTREGPARATLVARLFAGLTLALLGAACGGGQHQPACSPASSRPPAAILLDEALADSPLVVIGTVQRVLPSRVANDADPSIVGHPITAFDVRVEETLKGQAPSRSVRIRKDGGADLDCTLITDGYAPRAGDRGVFLLADAPFADGSRRLAAPNQGVYLFDRARPDLLVFAGPPSAARQITLDELRDRVR